MRNRVMESDKNAVYTESVTYAKQSGGKMYIAPKVFISSQNN